MENSEKMVLIDRISLSGSYMAFVVEKTDSDKYGKEQVKVACIYEKVESTIKHPVLVNYLYWPIGIVYGNSDPSFVKDLCIDALENHNIHPTYEEETLEV
jgi:hypothetical protein